MNSEFPALTLAQRLKSALQTWRLLAYSLKCELRVALPATVISFDAVKQTVNVQPVIRESLKKDGVPTPTEIPALNDVPIVVPRAGGFLTTLPIKPGDECLIVFGDTCIDAWWQSGGVQNQLRRRRHDLSDGFAIFGPWSQPNVVSNYSTTAAELRSEDGTVKVSLDADKVTVTAPTVNVTATSQVNITGAGHVEIEHKDFLLHTHTGVSSGGSNSGPVT